MPFVALSETITSASRIRYLPGSHFRRPIYRQLALGCSQHGYTKLAPHGIRHLTSDPEKARLSPHAHVLLLTRKMPK